MNNPASPNLYHRRGGVFPTFLKMYYVYLLKSQKSNWIYIGLTSDLDRRLKEHYAGKNYSTRRYLPVRLIYYEAYYSYTDVKNREKSLKQYGSALRLLKKHIKNSIEGTEGGAG